MTLRRRVNNVEQSVLSYQISTMVSFECLNNKQLNLDDLKEAVLLLKRKYPYLRMKIIRDISTKDKYLFVEQQNIDELENSIIELIEVNSSIEFENWPQTLNLFAYKPFDLEKTVFNVEVRRYLNKYQLYFGLNHTSCDIKGELSIVKDLLRFIDSLLDGIKQINNVESRPFLNVQDEINNLCDLESVIKEGVFANEIHEKFSKLQYPETDEHNLSVYKSIEGNLNAEYFDYAELKTQTFLSNCKANKATVQGVLSIIHLICVINETENLSYFDTKDLICLNQSLCEMRYCFNLSSEDVIKSASYLHWQQAISKDDNMWELAANASRKIHELRDTFDGLKYWFKLNHELPLHPQFCDVSSVGVVDLDGADLGLRNVRIDDVRFTLSWPENNLGQPKEEHDMTMSFMECFTFRRCMKFNITYSYPRLSQKWARHFVGNFFTLLDEYAKNRGQFLLKDVLPLLKQYEV